MTVHYTSRKLFQNKEELGYIHLTFLTPRYSSPKINDRKEKIRILTNDSKHAESTISNFASTYSNKKNDLQTGNRMLFNIKKKLKLKVVIHQLKSINPCEWSSRLQPTYTIPQGTKITYIYWLWISSVILHKSQWVWWMTED